MQNNSSLIPYLSSATLQAFLFDLDGTLVRTFIDFPAMRREMQNFSEQRGTGDATRGIDDILEIVAGMAQTLGGSAGQSARSEAHALLETREHEGCAHPERFEGATELLYGLRERGTKIACQRLNIPPEQTIMIGDLWADIASGKAAGVYTTIGIHWDFLPPDRFAQCPPDFVIRSLQELTPLLKD